MPQNKVATFHGYLTDLLAAVRAFQRDHRGPLKVQVHEQGLDEADVALLR